MQVRAASLKRWLHSPYEFIFSEEDSLLVKKLSRGLDGRVGGIEDFFGRKTGSLVTIYITRSDAEYYKYASRAVPEWSQAVAFPQKNLVVLRIKSAEEVKKSLQVLLHELVHIQIGNDFPGVRLPVWLNEGLAQYLSVGGLSFNEKILLANALAAKKIFRLSDIDSLHSFGPLRARLAYAQAKSAVEYFRQMYGLQALRQLVYNKWKYHSTNEAFKNTIGMDALDFELGWYSDLKSRYRWMIVLNLDNLIWILMSFLAVLAIVVIRYRNRKKIRLWDEREDEQ